MQLSACVWPLANQVILTARYTFSLRISEAVSLRPEHIDSQRLTLRVDLGNGAKDRYVMLSRRLPETLRDYWRRTRLQSGRSGLRREGLVVTNSDASTNPAPRTQ